MGTNPQFTNKTDRYLLEKRSALFEPILLFFGVPAFFSLFTVVNPFCIYLLQEFFSLIRCEIIKSNTKEWAQLSTLFYLQTHTHTHDPYNGLAIFNIHKYFYKIFNSNVNYFVGHSVWATTIQSRPLTVH